MIAIFHMQIHKEALVRSDLSMKASKSQTLFCKTLPASETSTHGGFCVPRRAAEKIFPPLVRLYIYIIILCNKKYHYFEDASKIHMSNMITQCNHLLMNWLLKICMIMS
ncbi:hypothetical protein DM860_018232 [Cuscuta australis]|uniref:Uncharacterized protein n=1 Tax=Cuscuta australis TaxID=267555 RepID=A0A328DCL3_9ASTE|nr:hypothetical protein DM860_018232 [Cuscuta australis]